MPLDVFSSNPAFSLTSLTLSLLRAPYTPGQIGRLGLFRVERLTTTTTMIEIAGQRLALVPELPRGAPPTPNVEDRRIMVPFKIPHFPIRDSLYADAVQNVRAFGSEDGAQAVQTVIDQRNASMALKLDVTLEYLRLGAVRGIIVTAADRITGAPITTVNLFTQFGVAAQQVLEWPIIGAGRLGQENPAWDGQLTGLINDLGRKMADELPGGMLTGIHGICGSRFFDAFTQHPERRAAFIAIENAPLLRPLLGTQTAFREVTIEEYRGRVGNVLFVQPDECHFFPVGVPDMFVEVYAPADYMETVNTVALPRYSKMELMDFDKGAQLEAQMNVLPICTSPRALFTAKAIQWEAPPDSGTEAMAESASVQGAAATRRR
jgi:Phage major capsid protein E